MAMRLNKIPGRNYIFAIFLIFCIALPGIGEAQSADQKKVRNIEVRFRITDDSGTSLPGAAVVIGEGLIHTNSAENGEVSFKASPDGFVAISMSGYEKKVILVKDLLSVNQVQLTKSVLFRTSDDVVPLPFMNLKRRDVTGRYAVVKGTDLEKYPSTDIRNGFTGLVPGLEVLELNGAPGMSPEEDLGVFGVTQKIAMFSRGRNVRYIIDDIPTSLSEMPLDPSEIESVTLITDIVGKAMYGPIGADGIVFIKTKRGKENERIFNVSFENGISTIDRMPDWVNGSEYANLSNLALTNSGLPARYSEDDITGFSKNDPYDMYHPSINFREMMLTKSMVTRRANVSSTGGNDVIQYFGYLGYSGDGDIYKIGPSSGNNRINARTNVDIKVNDFLKVQFNFFGGLTIRNSPNYGFDPQYASEGSDNSELDILEMGSVLDDITTTPPVAFPVYANNSPELESPWFAVSSKYGSNPIGNLSNNGYYSETGRQSSYIAAIEYDMSRLIPGLSSRTYVGFNNLNLVRLGKAEDYIAYITTPAVVNGSDTVLLTKVHDGVNQSDEANLHDYYFQRLSAYESLSYEKSFGENDFMTSLTYYLFKEAIDGIEEPRRQQDLVWTGLFSINNKYNIQGVLNYAGTYSFGKGKRYQLFPSIGASWIISDESFMEDLGFINYMKIRGEGGILGYESFLSPYYYRDDFNANTSGGAFGPHTSNQWFGTSTDNQVYRTTANRIGNPNLTWEKRKEFNIGFDALMFNRTISFEASYYNNLRDGIITMLNNVVPSVTGVSSVLPLLNYNKIRYYGIELGLQYTRSSGDFRYAFRINSTIQNSEYLKSNEPSFRFEYQSAIGKPVDAYFGLHNTGKFETDQEASEVVQVYDDVLHEGDLAYEDKNGDNIIDENDKGMIGHTTPRLIYSLNANISYRNFDFTVIGTGRALYDIPLTNNYYWNGWGDNTYSGFVRDNIGGAYPKLTYYKVNNNFIESDFWLTSGGFFKIQMAELAYNVPLNKLGINRSFGVRIFGRGANLLTISKIKEVDPESINSGVEVYPLFTTFTGGLKLTF